MKKQTQHPNREISPRTEQNFYDAYAREIPIPGRGILFVNCWTEAMHVLPKVETEYSVNWAWLETKTVRVNITRIYWLKFGIALVKPTEE